ncbi:hypothetical protein [Streptococcus sp. zg-JUN1979]|uniref:hypothetical protein n=1 Tax=Streptococcus sp. zg-JUN1979 TaxID=3391450 RepID=UPI0039A61884
MSKRSTQSSDSIIGTIIFIILVLFVLKFVLPIGLLAAGGYGIYRIGKYYTNKHKQMTYLTTQQRIETLQENIRQADRRIKMLDRLWEDKDFEQYSQKAQQLLPQIKQIQSEINTLRSDIGEDTYQRLKHRSEAAYDDILTALDDLKHPQNTSYDEPSPEKDDQTTTDFEKLITKEAPEILTTYQNIQRDHKTILQKIEEADNKEELAALHQVSMERFEDVLSGYLKIKASPKDYYNAEKRLSDARDALVQFDYDLDETLRQLNENDMKDFDISLRIMRDHLDNQGD